MMDLLEASPICTRDLRTGSLGMLVLDTQLVGLIRTDETLSESPPIS